MSSHKPLPSLDEINKTFYLDSDFNLRHKLSIGGVVKGSVAGEITNAGYRRVRINKVRFAAHRIIYMMHNGADPMDMEVDHIDGNRLNNNPSNLRLASRKENGRNRKVNANNKLGIKGVYWNSRDKKYCAFIKVDGVKINLGQYSNKHAAGKAYEAAAKKYFKQYVRS